MGSLLQPLSAQVPIVDPKTGRPTSQLIALLQALTLSAELTSTNGEIGVTGGAITNAMLANMAAATIKGNKEVAAGPPEDLTLSQVLDLIGGATWGDVLFRGTAGWQRLAAGAAGKILQSNGAGADPSWVTPTGGGGSGLPWYFKAPTAANFATMYAALRGGSITNAVSLANDAQAGMTFTDPSTDNGYMKAFGRPIPAGNIGGNFTITAHFKANSVNANDQFGIWARCSATKYVFFDFFNRGGTISVQRAYYNAAWSDGVYSLWWNGMDIWLRIAISGQNTSYYVSGDGKTWVQCYTTENLLAANYTDYGFCLGRFTLSHYSATCDSFTSDEYP